MKKRYFFIMALSVLILTGNQRLEAQCASNDAKAADAVIKSQDVGNKICPVTGEKIDDKSKASYEYQGKIYNFCCAMCIDVFKKDPQKYIKKVEEELQIQNK
jgi:YHS domain-containing protein